jgi:predicted nucleic acid-binding Zn ribbon protein
MKPLLHGMPAALADLLRNAPLTQGKVAFAWSVAVGTALDRVTRVKLERDVLIVEAASAQWSREVRRSTGVILPRLQALLGNESIRKLEVRRS